MSAPATPVLIFEAVTAWLAVARYHRRRHRRTRRHNRQWLRMLCDYLRRH